MRSAISTFFLSSRFLLTKTPFKRGTIRLNDGVLSSADPLYSPLPSILRVMHAYFPSLFQRSQLVMDISSVLTLYNIRVLSSPTVDWALSDAVVKMASSIPTPLYWINTITLGSSTQLGTISRATVSPATSRHQRPLRRLSRFILTTNDYTLIVHIVNSSHCPHNISIRYRKRRISCHSLSS